MITATKPWLSKHLTYLPNALVSAFRFLQPSASFFHQLGFSSPHALVLFPHHGRSHPVHAAAFDDLFCAVCGSPQYAVLVVPR